MIQIILLHSQEGSNIPINICMCNFYWEIVDPDFCSLTSASKFYEYSLYSTLTNNTQEEMLQSVLLTKKFWKFFLPLSANTELNKVLILHVKLHRL